MRHLKFMLGVMIICLSSASVLASCPTGFASVSSASLIGMDLSWSTAGDGYWTTNRFNITSSEVPNVGTGESEIINCTSSFDCVAFYGVSPFGDGVCGWYMGYTIIQFG